MPRTPVDPQTAERLLQGRLAADDLPPGLDGVAAVLEAARRSTADSDFSRIDSTVDSIGFYPTGRVDPASVKITADNGESITVQCATPADSFAIVQDQSR